LPQQIVDGGRVKFRQQVDAKRHRLVCGVRLGGGQGAEGEDSGARDAGVGEE